MNAVTRNYTEQGGERTVIGGELVIEAGAKLEVKEGAEILGLSASGGGKKIPAQPDSEATTVAQLKGDFNSLLAKLRQAGLMEE